VAFQLTLDRRVVGQRVAAVQRREIEHVHEQLGALDVGKEVVTEAGAVARAPISPGMSATISWRCGPRAFRARSSVVKG